MGHESARYIHVENGKIKDIAQDERYISGTVPALRLHFDNALAFPGLINSHDHLDFNLFPRLGNHIYESYIDWGADIQMHNKSIIEAITKIPIQFRVQWGLYKNLLNGITTVVHHGKYLNIENPIINVYQNCHSLHSVGREKNWKLKLNNPFAKHQPFVIHVGEGTNKESSEEIDQLTRWNFFQRPLIGVHGVSMNPHQAKNFEALIWCPDSNFFLLNATARIRELKQQTKILFGTDSTVSANWNLWEQLRVARRTNMLTDQELFDSLTKSPASEWKLDGNGALAQGKTADIVIAKLKDEQNSLNGFFQTDPADILAILKNGELVLFDEALNEGIEKRFKSGFNRIFISNRAKYVRGNLVELVSKIKTYAPVAKFPVEIHSD